ncbi:MAG: DUF1292 domain-containing protein [Acidaminococcaceae bacterium]|jgi:uncharacterized protein YrzB (UPF0473 family)|nr:DUF1292 domain-containing protein [Acidaminococcaceae bacterium]MCI2110299.1 DUF1292 domain-containing protein [Acidaminococcaceae bacterium]
MKDEKSLPEAEDIENTVVVTDSEGKETYYREEMVIPLDKKNFAILVEDCDSDEDNAVVARIDFDEAGEPIYLDPTEEEFAAVMDAYDKLMAETKEEED